MKARCLFGTMFFLFVSQAFSAGFDVSESRFRFHPDLNDFNQFDNKRWNPNFPVHETGIYIYYHGHIDDGITCSVESNCETSACFKENPPWNISQLAGLDNATAWAPKCPGTPYYGITMGATSTSSSNGYKGIGLYTHTGPNFAYLGNSFFQPKHIVPDHKIMGTYVGFEAQAQGSMRPFSAACSWRSTPSDCNNNVRMRVWSKQVVKNVNTPTGTQAQQKMAALLHNTADFSEAGRIELTPYTLCSGINCSSNTGNSSFDPNQGGAAYVGGPILTGGQATLLSDGTPTWESYGSATKSGVFDTTWFHYEVSWGNFIGILRHMTTKAGKNGSLDSDVASLFGVDWDIPENWELKNYRYGQEVFNPDWNNGIIASVGGHTNWIQVEAIKR